MKLLAAAMVAALLATTAFAQPFTPNITYIGPDGSVVEGVRCATVTPDDNPESPGDILQWLQEHFDEIEGTLFVPVAFHVVTANNGTGDVPDDQIQEQIDTLNSGFAPWGVQFYLSNVDRTPNDTWFYNTKGSDAQMKAALAIDPTHNLNLYTANIGGGILGYAYLPWSFPESSTLHGVVVLYSSLPGGSAFPYDEGETATHEVGHYLGLFHTFERGCSAPGDEVDDTPYEASPAFGCPTGRNTCSNEPEPDPIHNYMDYTYDACMYEFTQGQSDRIDWAVNTYKPGLLEAAIAPVEPADVAAYSDYATPTSIALTWTDPTTLTTGDTLLIGYYHMFIERDGAFLDSLPGGVEQYTDAGLTEGQSYSYEIYAKLDSSEIPGNTASVVWTAGGSVIPGTPVGFSVTGNQQEVTLNWTNPSGNSDGTPMIDFAGINLYRDGTLATTFARTPSDTGLAESILYAPPSPGQYDWYLTALDNEIPPHESPPTATLATPLGLPLLDIFTDSGSPNPSFWITTNADVNTRSNNPTSPPYALNLNGSPIGSDTVEMVPVDMSTLQGSGVAFAYFYQPQGNGNAPEAGDSLRLYFRNDLGAWVRILAYAGRTLQPFQQEAIDIATAPDGGGSYFHSQFQVRFVSTGLAGALPNDDWFVDNVFLGLPAPAIAASQDTVAFDTTMIGATSEMTLDIANVGLEDLNVNSIVSTNPSIFSIDTTSFLLSPGGSITITVSFTPDQPGVISGSLLFASNDPNQDTLTVHVTGMGDIPVTTEGEGSRLPASFLVSPNYPNPFNPTTKIKFELPEASQVNLTIFNLLGSKVRTLTEGRKEAGYHEAQWDGRNDAGHAVTSGVYIYRLTAGSYQSLRKMILVK